MKKRPNVLLLFSDQRNARVLGCQGDEQAVTPNLDRLASEGVRFGLNRWIENFE